MAKTYYCEKCGHTPTQWIGCCTWCNSWNTIKESKGPPPPSAKTAPELLSAIGKTVLEPRLNVKIGELNRVLGGGLVPDSFVLIGGEPGIGKSTLLLQFIKGFHANHPNQKILYVSGEESLDQIRARAERLGVAGDSKVFLSTGTVLEEIFKQVETIRPQVLLLDSIQTLTTDRLEAPAGSIPQMRAVTSALMKLAKGEGISVWLVGHVTKDGSIAGPKAVEHLVDTVLYFEAEGSYRLLRATKNRFGSAKELGVFEMQADGLHEVPNPSALFLNEANPSVPGTAVVATLEGSRVILAEVQALCVPSLAPQPRRTCVGVDPSRVTLIAAILEKYLKLDLSSKDLFISVSGGLKISDPACDLGIAAAIWSSVRDQAIPRGWCFMGELGLTGEVRRVEQSSERITEASRFGFGQIVVPHLPGLHTDKNVLPIKTISALPDLF